MPLVKVPPVAVVQRFLCPAWSRQIRRFFLTWFFYVVRTVDSCLYAGIATDVGRRFEEHRSGRRGAAKYLRVHKPASLVFSAAIGDRSLALKVEYRFKKLVKKDKEAIIGRRKLVFNDSTGDIIIPYSPGAGRNAASRH